MFHIQNLLTKEEKYAILFYDKPFWHHNDFLKMILSIDNEGILFI